MKSPLYLLIAASIGIVALGLAAGPSEAQTRKPTTKEIAALRD